MNEMLSKLVDYAMEGNGNEFSGGVQDFLRQKIDAELKDLKIDIAQNTYTFHNNDKPVSESINEEDGFKLKRHYLGKDKNSDKESKIYTDGNVHKIKYFHKGKVVDTDTYKDFDDAHDLANYWVTKD